MVGMIIEATGGHRAGLAALGVQSILGALVLFGASGGMRLQSPTGALRQQP
jgi:hypothetical protein